MMEKLYGPCQDEDQMDLPPGFRFHPTDEELINHYLLNKVVDYTFVAKAIGEVDMNKIEPWELPSVAKMGEKEWYFFCARDKKYPTGLRTNRATAAGYWKATGKDKEIFMGRSLIGMKKTLVFYIGRAPKGEKTDWVIHEYRLEGKFSHINLPKSAKTEWVICHVSHKNSGEKKVQISGLMRADSGGVATPLPPLMNQSISESNYVHCFSNPIENQPTQKNMNTKFINNSMFPFELNPNPLVEGESNPIMHQFPSGSPFAVCDHAILRGLIGNYGHGLKMETKMITSSQDTKMLSKFEKGKRGIGDQEASSTSIGQVDLDCFWNY